MKTLPHVMVAESTGRSTQHLELAKNFPRQRFATLQVVHLHR